MILFFGLNPDPHVKYEQLITSFLFVYLLLIIVKFEGGWGDFGKWYRKERLCLTVHYYVPFPPSKLYITARGELISPSP